MVQVGILRFIILVEQLLVLCIPIFAVCPVLYVKLGREVSENDLQFDLDLFAIVVEIAALMEVMLIDRVAARQSIWSKQQIERLRTLSIFRRCFRRLERYVLLNATSPVATLRKCFMVRWRSCIDHSLVRAKTALPLF